MKTQFSDIKLYEDSLVKLCMFSPEILAVCTEKFIFLLFNTVASKYLYIYKKNCNHVNGECMNIKTEDRSPPQSAD